MFKVLVLQSLYNLSDERIEFQIRDRISFMRFLDLTLGDAVPDEKTIWLFREQLTEAGVIKRLFEEFEAFLGRERVFGPREAKSSMPALWRLPGSAIAGTRTDRSRREQTPEDWSEQKKRQKDTDARWTQKERTESLRLQESY